MLSGERTAHPLSAAQTGKAVRSRSKAWLFGSGRTRCQRQSRATGNVVSNVTISNFTLFDPWLTTLTHSFPSHISWAPTHCGVRLAPGRIISICGFVHVVRTLVTRERAFAAFGGTAPNCPISGARLGIDPQNTPDEWAGVLSSGGQSMESLLKRAVVPRHGG